MSELLAIIPAYRRPEQLDRCRAALQASTVPIEPWLFDNNKENLGYTKACNAGLRESLARGHDFALLLNQDCYLRQDAVEKLLAFMESHPACAIAGVKQLKAEEPDFIVHGGCADAYPAGRHFTGRVSAGQCNTSALMPWVNGACMLVRLAAVREIGLMDEGYFLIASDSDYCFTARARGWEVWYCAEAVALHESGGVSGGAAPTPPALEHLAHLQADQRHFRDKWVGTLGWELLRQQPPNRELQPQEVTAAVQRMNGHYAKNEFGPAELVARALLQWEPGQGDAELTLARLYIRQNMPAIAARDLERLVMRRPDWGVAWVALADAQVSCGFADRAVACYQRGIELGLRGPDLQNNLGVALLRAGRREEGIAAWREALRLDPTNPTAQKNLADAGAAKA